MCPQIMRLCILHIGKCASGAGLYDKMLTTFSMKIVKINNMAGSFTPTSNLQKLACIP